MSWWNYLVLVNIYLLLFYGFYALLLRRETFFQLNRIYLISASLLSFFIPLIQSDWVKNLFITQKVQYTLYGSPVLSLHFTPAAHSQITIGEVLGVVYLVGMFVLTIRFLLQLNALKRIIAQPQPSGAFSFFKKVNLGTEVEHKEIIAAHENVHAQQWHSIDVLLIEAVMIINWFNPVVYLYRYAIKHIHEFIADRQAIKHGTQKSDYAMLLLSQTFNAPSHQLVNPFFNHSLLKQRIMMLQKNNSQKIALIKYGLSAPLFILMLILSSATVNNSKPVRFFNVKVRKVFLSPASGMAQRNISSVILATTDKNGEAMPAGKRKFITIINNDTVPAKTGPVFTSVEEVPEFPGGLNALGTFLAKNIKYPKASRDKSIQGKVIISFIVETDGHLSSIRVARGVASDIDNEAIRVMSMSPVWKNGTQNGKPVRVAYTIPISFSLDGSMPVPHVENKSGAVIEENDPSKTRMAAVTNIVIKKDTGTTAQYTLTQIKGNPLYMLDGKEVKSLDAVNPSDIESIVVLKDNNAAALYGAKGENGVIVISTKKNTLKLSPAKPLKN